MDQPRVSSKRHSRHQEIPQPPVVTQEYVDEQSIKLIDILPLVLCIGIIVLLYFIVRELQSEQEQQETRYTSLLKRLETMEKKSDVKVPEASSMKKEGTYVLKNSVVSFKPEEDDIDEDDEDDDDTIEIPEKPDIDESDGSEDDEDGAFS